MHASDQEMEKAWGQEEVQCQLHTGNPDEGRGWGRGFGPAPLIYRPHPHWSTLVCTSKLKEPPAWGLDTSAQETFFICELWPPLADQWLPMIFPMDLSSCPLEGLLSAKHRARTSQTYLLKLFLLGSMSQNLEIIFLMADILWTTELTDWLFSKRAMHLNCYNMSLKKKFKSLSLHFFENHLNPHLGKSSHIIQSQKYHTNV